MARSILITTLMMVCASVASMQTPAQAQKAIQDCPTCPEVMVIPSGSFMFGTHPSAFELDKVGRGRAEAGQIKINISQSFAMGRTEVTRAQYAAFVMDAGYDPETKFCRIWDQVGRRFSDVPKRNWNDPGLLSTARDDHPVTCVSWDDALAYTQWLSKQTGKRYRLPSEVEWEYAARAGSNKKRFWSDDASEGCAYANTYDLTASRLSVVMDTCWVCRWISRCRPRGLAVAQRVWSSRCRGQCVGVGRGLFYHIKSWSPERSARLDMGGVFRPRLARRRLDDCARPQPCGASRRRSSR